MAKRLKLDRVKTVLDVGCGIGHWGQLWAPLFSKDVRVIGIDREEAWVGKATERALKFGINDRYTYQRGDAQSI